MRTCHSCAGRPQDGATFGPRKWGPVICLDCQAETERSRTRTLYIGTQRKPLITRASHQAALWHRERSPQADLVDLVAHVMGISP